MQAYLKPIAAILKLAGKVWSMSLEEYGPFAWAVLDPPSRAARSGAMGSGAP